MFAKVMHCKKKCVILKYKNQILGVLMKKFLFVLLSFIIFCSTGVVFCATSSGSVFADSCQNDVTEFLKFEQAVIDFNNADELQIDSDNQRDLMSANNDSTNKLQEQATTKSEFCLKRLIVQGDVADTYGAVDKISYNNMHILCYATEQSAKAAYEKLTKIDGLDVIIDRQEMLQNYAEKDYSYSSYTNWGAQSIDIGGYRQYLVDNNVKNEVVVVVMDTGINTSHPMFANRLLTDKNGKIKGFSYYNSKYQYSYQNLSFDVDDETTANIIETDTNKYSFEDDHSHGSHVAGIVCDLTPSNVKILPIKISGANGHSSTSVFISAYLRVINIYSRQYKIACTNLSFSGAGKESESEKNTFNSQCYEPLLNLNILPITAAGNDYAQNDIEGLKAVVVSALKKHNDNYVFDADYSNYGKIIDISAPGSEIYSAGISTTDSASSALVHKDGTSMAAPQVAGVAALLYLNPSLPASTTALQIEQMLYDLSLDMGQPNKDIYYGHGILNLKYFQVPDVSAELNFYRNNQLIENYVQNENFESAFNLSIECSNPNFQIIYTTNKTMPTLANSTKYSAALNVESSVFIYAMGVLLQDNKIVARTDLYNVSFFNVATPIEDCFDVSSRGYLENYTGNYTHLTIPSTLKGKVIYGLEPSVFKHSNIESITLPETCTTIGGYVFQYCKNLKYIYAPNVTKIYISAFSECVSLTSVCDQHPSANTDSGAYLPQLTETIGFSFSGCTQLKSVSSSKLTTLGDMGYDFQACTNLTQVNLPSITSIPEGTFKLCESLTGTFHVNPLVQTVGLCAFAGCNINQFQLDSNNQYLYSDGFGLYSHDTLLAFAGGNQNVDYSILESVNIQGSSSAILTIAESVFLNAQLNSLTIPSSVVTLQAFAFLGSTINILHYNATNCSESGYFDKESYFRAAVFDTIDTIEIGENVRQIPERLFQEVFFDNLIINSASTIFKSACFYRFAEQGVLNSLVFNFYTSIDSAYLTMVADTSNMFSYNDVNFLYSKTTVPVQSNFRFSALKYSTFDGEYYIYSKSPIIKQFTITSTSTTNGSILPSGENLFAQGEDITFVFVADVGYCVDSIIVDGVALSGDQLNNVIKNGYTFFDLSGDHTISVSYVLATYTITYLDQNGNTLQQNLSPTTYSYGNSIQLPTPAQKQGYTFVGWFDNINFSGSPITQILPTDFGDKTYYAKFEIITFTIQVIQSQHGTISPSSNSYNYGSTVRFTFTADAGYHTQYLLIDGQIYTDSLTEYTFTNITQNHTVGACFEPNVHVSYTVRHWHESLTQSGATAIGAKYYVLVATDTSKTGPTGAFTQATANSYAGFTAQPIEQKTIVDNSTAVDILYDRNIYVVNVLKSSGVDNIAGGGSYLFGQTVSLSATLFKGYAWLSWQSSNTDIVASSTEQNYSFAMPASNIDLTATATIQQFYITILSAGNGYVTPATNQMVDYGDNLQLSFFASFGYELLQLTIDGTDVTGFVVDNKYTISNITQNHTVSVVFDSASYNITAQTAKNGTISPSGVTSVKHGGSQKYLIVANFGYHLTGVSVDGVALPSTEVQNIATNGYTFADVVENHTISATFEKNVYTITAAVSNNGTISPSGNIKVSFGDNKTFTLTAHKGYQIDKIYIDNQVFESITIYTFKDVDQNHNIYVSFKKITYSILASCGANGAISPQGTSAVGHGENITYSFAPNIGYKVKDVKIDNTSIGAVDSYMFANVNCQHTIFVEFELKKFNIILSVEGKGSVKADKPLQNINFGEDITLSIFANTGWELFEVYINEQSVEVTDNQIVINDIDNDINIKVIFKLKVAIICVVCILAGAAAIASVVAVLVVKLKKRTKQKKHNNPQQSDVTRENRRNKKTKKLQLSRKKSNNNTVRQTASKNTADNQTTSQMQFSSSNMANPTLQQALSFVKGRTAHFMSFCAKYGIDYQTNYYNAAIKYYQAYLDSKKPNQPPKNDN